MPIAERSDVDVLLERFLLPSAPPALVTDVHRYLSESQSRGGRNLSRSGREATRNGASSRNGVAGDVVSFDVESSLSHRSPWQLLHVALCAPQAVVDIAYDFRRRNQAVCPTAPPIKAVWSPVPASANDRLAGLATPSMLPRAATNGANAPRAFVEAATDGQRYSIAERPLRIGTDVGCDVVVRHNKAVEVRIWPYGERYMLRVVSGAVRIAGESTPWVVLDDGDILEIGDATFRFRLKDTP